ncbi:aminoglycoside phosphotransferase family protein [Streptomyces sp. NPDC046759]|uniref:aminoglycoside phosphotransferase family protein n=1 Tax=Streptomyces sp. NPDC046759 TaxID=3155019 RepID=UPI00340EC852
MRHGFSFVVDRSRYQYAPTPWEQESWRASALDWMVEQLASHGLRARGELRVRLRPWSVLVRVPVVGRDAVWFKANPPASGFEGPLTAALARWVPEQVLAPLAVDAERAWVLLPDGGDLFRDVLARAPVEPRTWEELLRQYASAQRALSAHSREIERLGVPSARTPDLPGVFDELLAANAALRPEARVRLERLRPRLAEWCAELASAGIEDTLDHADLHDGQVFHRAPDRFIFFDWGDAAVSHPFCSLRTPVGKARARFGPHVLDRLLDAYLEPWTGAGRTAAELRRAAHLAWRLSALARAASWGRVFPDASNTAPGAEQSSGSLLELCTDPPF